MNTEKRLLVAFALSMGVLLLWGAFFGKPPHPPVKPAVPPAAQKSKPITESPAHAAAPRPASPPASLAVEQGTATEDIVVNGPLYRVTFSTEGAIVKSWVLTKYQDEHGKPLNVVNTAACRQLGFPMKLSTGDPKLDGELNEADFVAKPAGTMLKAPVTLEFVYSNGKIEARKKFVFGDNYQVSARMSVFDGKKYFPIGVEWPGGFGDQSVGAKQEEAASSAVYDNGQNLKVDSLASFGPSLFDRLLGAGGSANQHTENKARTVPGPLQFAGLQDRYFAGIFFPGSTSEGFDFEPQLWKDSKGKKAASLQALTAGIQNPQAAPLKFRLFVAPKAVDVLRTTDPPLSGLLDWGWFGFIAKPFFYAMQYMVHHWIHNYGWAIVILTVLISVAVFPLRLKSIRAAQEMQRLAPHVKAIQDRYKQYKFNDPRKQRMNQEMMKLYQEHGVNPIGGCLPTLLQLPVIYAFYRMLELPIEFRHARWILWFNDLSQPDHSRLFGLPIPIMWAAMMAASFVMTVITPMPTPDRQQRTMMMIMPLFIGFLFIHWASGLVLYYLTFSVVSITQQLLINRFWPITAPPCGPPKPAAAVGKA